MTFIAVQLRNCSLAISFPVQYNEETDPRIYESINYSIYLMR